MTTSKTPSLLLTGFTAMSLGACALDEDSDQDGLSPEAEIALDEESGQPLNLTVCDIQHLAPNIAGEGRRQTPACKAAAQGAGMFRPAQQGLANPVESGRQIG